MTIIERNIQQAAIENALKLAFIKLQQTGGFTTVDGVQTPDRTAYNQILDAIRVFDPNFAFGDEPKEPSTPETIYKELTALMKQYSKFGAQDSEGFYALDRVEHAATHREPFPLRGANPWELYESVHGWQQASHELTEKAREYWEARKR